MIDTHLHVLPKLDDGSRSITESVKILQQLQFLGFTDVICTPHFIPDSPFCPDNRTKRASMKELNKAIKKHDIALTLHLGNEVYVDPNIPDFIKAKQIQLINQQYLLFELPFYAEYQGLHDLLHNLKVKGITPILAHPERYSYFQEKYQLVAELKSRGLLFQVNYGSIIGQYGSSAKRLVKYLFKNHYVDFLGTDIHHADSQIFDRFPRIQHKITRLIGKDEYESILKNAKKLIP